MVAFTGALATISCKPRQVRKEATVVADTGAEMLLVEAATILESSVTSYIRMSYQVLARKWRPNTFAEMVGQQPVVDALSRALTLERWHHAYLFTGTRGVGKTTIARLLAKCFCCEKGVTANPCGTCSSCQEIKAGCYPELIEVDAASRTRVEETRELLDNINYLPTRGRFKIYLIDEVHMLSTHSFNALLKTLEEPPEHAKIFFATTDPQKLPATILSRTLQYHLKPVLPQVIANHLEHILQQENIVNEFSALEIIAQQAQGSVRDALTLLDQAIAYGAGEVNEAVTRSMLGLGAPEYLFLLLDAIAMQEGEKLWQELEKVAQDGLNFETLLMDILTVLQRVASLQVIPTLKHNVGFEKEYRALAQKISAENVQLLYSIALLGRRDMTLAPNPRSAFEMIMLRMLAFMPAKAETPTIAVSSSKAPAPMILAPSLPQTAPIAVAPTISHTASTPTPAASAIVFANNQSWSEIIENLKLVGLTSALVKNSVLLAYQNDCVDLGLSVQHEPLYSESQQHKIADALTAYWGRPTKVKFIISTFIQETPMHVALKAEKMAKTELVAKMQNDPGIKELEKELGAVLDVHSIQAITES